MRRSNRNFNSPPPPGKPRRFDHFLCPGSGEFDLFLGVVGKIEPEVSVLFFRALKSLTYLDETEEIIGRDIILVRDWLTKKKVLKSCVVFLKVCMRSRECLNINDFRF